MEDKMSTVPKGLQVVVEKFEAPYLPGLPRTAKRVTTVTAKEWNEKFSFLESAHGDFLTETEDGWRVTAVSRKGVFHLRKRSTVLHVKLDPTTLFELYK